MSYLLDTSILVRLANVADAKFAQADRAIAELEQRGETLHLTAQNLIEFRNVATRPKAVNGLGLTVRETESKSAIFEGSFTLLPEAADIYPAWKSLVMALGVIGKQVHDARLVAVCHVHGSDPSADLQPQPIHNALDLWPWSDDRRSGNALEPLPLSPHRRALIRSRRFCEASS